MLELSNRMSDVLADSTTELQQRIRDEVLPVSLWPLGRTSTALPTKVDAPPIFEKTLIANSTTRRVPPCLGKKFWMHLGESNDEFELIESAVCPSLPIVLVIDFTGVHYGKKESDWSNKKVYIKGCTKSKEAFCKTCRCKARFK
jgi:hypothetical protein